MLLSIVECNDYKLWDASKSLPIDKTQTSGLVEIIGPVTGPNVSYMRNEGAKIANGEWIFFKDKDCEVEIAKILQVLREIKKLDHKIAAIGGVYTCKSRSVFENCYHLIQKKWVFAGLTEKQNSKTFLANHLLGGAYLVKRDVLLKTKGFDEKIGWGAEESDLTKRIQKLGFKTAVSYNLKVKHKNNLKISGFFKRAWHQNFNKSKFQINFDNKKNKSIYLTKNSIYFFPTLFYFAVSLLANSAGRSSRRFNQIKQHELWGY